MVTHYQFLEPKPYKRWTRQLGLKGRNMLASQLVAIMRTNGWSVEETAQNYGLPVEAVEEAIAYVDANEEWIRSENRKSIASLAPEP